jgi:hypothetical protein
MGDSFTFPAVFYDLQALTCDDTAFRSLIQVSIDAARQQNRDMPGSAIGIGPKDHSAIMEIHAIGTSGLHPSNLRDNPMSLQSSLHFRRKTGHLVAILSFNLKFLGPSLTKRLDVFKEAKQ